MKSLNRRKAILGTLGMGAAILGSTPTAYAADDNAGFGKRLEIAFDGVAYPSWDTSNLYSGFMALVQVRAPLGRTPFKLQMSLQHLNGDPLPVRQGEKHNPYRSLSLNGTAMDWAILNRPSATITLFIPYECLDVSRADTGKIVDIRMHFQLLTKTSNGWNSPGDDFNRTKTMKVSFHKEGQPMIQRIVHFAAGPPGSSYALPHEAFSSDFDSNENWNHL